MIKHYCKSVNDGAKTGGTPREHAAKHDETMPGKMRGNRWEIQQNRTGGNHLEQGGSDYESPALTVEL
jgi:hypothetical protein